MGSQYIRIAKFNLDAVLPFIGKGNPPKTYADKPVKMNSLRYQVFKKSGTKCKVCGLEGIFFALEKDKFVEGDLGFHLNLYGLSRDGEEILMTKDHILPKSKGGADKLTNLQTLCIKCNNAKGNKIPRRKKYMWVHGKTDIITTETKKPRIGVEDLLIVYREYNGFLYFEELLKGKKHADLRGTGSRTKRLSSKQCEKDTL